MGVRQGTLVTITKKIEEKSFFKFLLDQLEKGLFWNFHDN
jgi:hypothetical protein